MRRVSRDTGVQEKGSQTPHRVTAQSRRWTRQHIPCGHPPESRMLAISVGTRGCDCLVGDVVVIGWTEVAQRVDKPCIVFYFGSSAAAAVSSLIDPWIPAPPQVFLPLPLKLGSCAHIAGALTPAASSSQASSEAGGTRIARQRGRCASRV